MKKRILFVLSLLLIFSVVLTGCSSNKKDDSKDQEKAAGDTTQGANGDASIGLGMRSSVAKSKDAADGNGVAEFSSMVAAVIVDKDGKIVKAVIDALPAKVEFDKEGKLVTPVDTTFDSKNELKENYGMKGVSGISKEWYEQAEFFATYIQGKTLKEIKDIAIDQEGLAADEDLRAGITVHIGEFIAVVEDAMSNLKPGVSADDMLGLGIKANASGSQEAAAEDGVAKINVTYVASAFNADNKITGAIIDQEGASVSFDAKGKITSDIQADVQSKNQLKEEYGMKKASEIGKEWYEQADAFANYIVGKTADEVKGIALEEGKPADEDIKSSVTIHVGDIQETLEEAASARK